MASRMPGVGVVTVSERRSTRSVSVTGSPYDARRTTCPVAPDQRIRARDATVVAHAARGFLDHGALGTASAAGEHLGHEERQLERLLVVKPGVAQRLVAGGEVGLVDPLGAAEALGDVVARQFDVQ